MLSAVGILEKKSPAAQNQRFCPASLPERPIIFPTSFSIVAVKN